MPSEGVKAKPGQMVFVYVRGGVRIKKRKDLGYIPEERERVKEEKKGGKERRYKIFFTPQAS